MPNQLKTYMNWSSGKDASLALYYLQKNPAIKVDRFLTSINAHHDRVSMHGLSRTMLLSQIQAIGLPVTMVELPEEPQMADYNRLMGQTVKHLVSLGYRNCGFGDIFLEDLRNYREDQLKPYGIQCHFPLWRQDTKKIIQDFIDLGFKAKVICLNSKELDDSFLGSEIDREFINKLPSTVDPCGENGEFHTFCYDGPIFNHPVEFDLGEKIFRTYKSPDKKESAGEDPKMGFWFLDLIPKII